MISLSCFVLLDWGSLKCITTILPEVYTPSFILSHP